MSTKAPSVPQAADPGTAAGAPQPQFMVVPSLACPARCGYCFGPHQGPIMSPEVADATVAFIARIAEETGMTRVRVTFHGGEPLMAGSGLFRRILTGLRDRLGADRLRLAIQSNLWHLDDEFCTLFREYRVEIGTSLDGPESITDAQRGAGYFARTLAGIRRAQAHGLQPGCIATFTPASAPRWREVFDFFLNERLGFSVHPALRPLGGGDPRHALPPDDYGRLLCDLADHYIAHRRDLAIGSLDQVCQSLGTGQGQTCTFRDCLGMFIAIDPSGDLYPCQRLCGHPDWRLGHLADRPSLAELLDALPARRLAERERRITEDCAGCAHLPYCRGGCPYNAAAAGDSAGRDPNCPAYRTLFDHLQRRLTVELAAPENIDAVAARPWDGQVHPLLRRGPLIDLVRAPPHPHQVARTARRIVAAVELARGPDRPAVAARLVAMGICRTQASGEASLAGLWSEFYPPTRRLNNLYLHLTWRCQLRCSHCYARADAHGGQQGDMPVADLSRLLSEARETQFRQVILTGGEPLMHSQRPALLATLTRARERVAPMNLILRSNLALPLQLDDLRQIARAVDQLVVSVDGDEATHDARRGPGSYAQTVQNLEAYQDAAARLPGAAELSLAAVMRATDSAGPPGDAVRDLAGRLKVRRTRFRPILPIGRAADWDEPPTSEALGAHADPLELIEGGFRPVAGCGLGQNLYIEPSGEAFPCYAYHRPHGILGNVVAEGLASVINSARFADLCGHSVDTNPRCKECEVRYLCGGACRAWGGERTQYDLDAPPPECQGLKARAEGLLRAALVYLDFGSRSGNED
ncbi:TIGR04083 family peptide-modifying radical SAM enzyme [Lamprocystis purpurea]|uniref:TIGR04083 family peptide-modifying radical SAM enzyme n=1 Tax=Lamprocystis purpurea TaxID=61598 RepID=UPI00039AE494|nr:TIGR04083 family peptide-modifying radical SAM enzyme [Lamprocystis purpurea]